ncbi:hypothetical protein M0D21_00215 [Aquimarina sp. D1M17]|uniref:CARDB domain-containing protein n=1 Tax=Aquimarina acroporae TaxID=2937283 RepID=UPI0020BD6709|nr:CARDB domain-containing protein [Aquimarina acroporae]MCK8519972.1 hypothetical protein [Aquimarina acroporae]
MRTNIILFLFLLMNYSLFSNFTGSFYDNKSDKKDNKEICSPFSYQISITVEIYKDKAFLIPPNDFRIDEYSNVSLNVYYQYKTEQTNLSDVKLEIAPSSTSLIPVKIPPPNQSSGRMITINQNSKTYLGTFTVHNYRNSTPGSKSIGFGLVDCNTENCDLTNPNYLYQTSVDYTVYEYKDLRPYYNDYTVTGNTAIFALGVCDDYRGEYENVNNDVHIYISDDKTLDNTDLLVYTKRLTGFHDPNDYFNSCVSADFRVNISLLSTWVSQNKHLILKADATNRHYESVEDNNILSIQLQPELEISDIRAYKRPDTNVILSSTITNTGNVPSEVSKLDFYVERYPRTFVSRRTVPSLQPGESYTVNSLVTWQYYSLVLHGRDLIVIADADNNVTEIDETNNEKIFRIPRNLGSSNNEQTYVTIAPNPYSSYIEFHYPVNYVNTDIKLSIYDQRGVLQYHTSKFHEETGNFKFKIYANEINNGINGVYYYSFLLGRFNTSYFPFTGTIIKQ